MAQKRMFNKDIVRSDAFLSMPDSSQLLYFQLGMEADDDGFLSNTKTIVRMLGINEDDLKVLLAKRFILEFQDGIIVIKHWRINNYIQNDRYKETKYLDAKKMLFLKKNGSYTLDSGKGTPCIQDVSRMDTQVRLGKAREEEVDKSTSFPRSGEPETMTVAEWREKTGKEAKIPRNKVAWGLRAKFGELCTVKLGITPALNANGYYLCLSALKYLTETQILDLFDEWFSLGRPDEELVQITRALSANQINGYKARNHV